MKILVLIAAVFALLAAPTSIRAAQDSPDEHKYIVTGRVVDKFGKPVPKAELQLKPKGSTGGCIIEMDTADEEGRFRIEKQSSALVENWMLFITTPTPPNTDVPISPDVGRVPVGGHEFLLKTGATDLGDVPVQVCYGPVLIHLPEVSPDRLIDKQSGLSRLGLRVSDMKGDVIGDGGVAVKSVNTQTLTLLVALPEGVWQVKLSLGELNKWYAPEQPVVIKYSEPVAEYALVSAENSAHASELDMTRLNSAEDARRELEKLGIPYNEKAFIERIERDNLNAVQLFLQAGINPNSQREDGTTGLLIATGFGFTDMVKALLNKGADVNMGNAIGLTPLAFAVSGYDLDIVKLLLSSGANINAKDESGCTPLMRAARSYNRTFIEMVLGAGADIKAQDNAGDTALSYAIESGDSEILLLLLKHGASIQSRNHQGKTILMQAAERGSLSCVEALLTKGAAIEAKANDGSTALMVAAREGQAEMVRFLLANGADASAKTKKGTTVLMFAAEGGDVECAKALLDKGTDVKGANAEGKTALSIATAMGHTEMVKLLKNAKAKQ